MKVKHEPEVKFKFIPKCQCPIQPIILGVNVACAECGRLYETEFEVHNLGKEEGR